MAKRTSGKKGQTAEGSANGGIVALTKELFQAAIVLRGSIEPADYKRYVLPIIFLRFLSLRYDRRRAELEKQIADKKSEYYGYKKALTDPDEYRSVGAFIIPEAARWQNLRKAAQAHNIKVRLDDVLEALETKYPAKLKGLLPRIYAGSNLDADSVRGLINLFSKDIFEADHGGDDLIGRVYEYFIGEFASSEGKRGGEYFTPVSIVKTLVAMLEPEKGVVFDPCCGSGGMFVQSDLFTKHSRQLSFCGQESKDFTYRLCRMNLFIHGLARRQHPAWQLVFRRQARDAQGRLRPRQSPVQRRQQGRERLGRGQDRRQRSAADARRPEAGLINAQCQHDVDAALSFRTSRTVVPRDS
jgi:type I restriction enzyme M protein